MTDFIENHVQSTKASRIEVLVAAVLIFCLIYRVNFVNFPTLALTALIALSILYFRRTIRSIFSFNNLMFFMYLMALMLLLFYTVFLCALSYCSDSTLWFRLPFFLIYSVYGAFLICVIIKFDGLAFSLSFFLAVLAQSIFILIDFFSSSFHGWLLQNLTLPVSAHVSTIRAIGLTNITGAALSVTQALGFFSSLLVIKFISSRRLTLFSLIGSVIILFSIILTGRTGLVLTILYLGVFILASGWKSFFYVSFLLFSLLLSIYFIGEGRLYAISSWSLSIFTGEDKTISVILDMHVPDFNLELITGSGRFVEADGSNYSKSDIGYIQNIVGYGLIPMFIFYSLTFWLLFSRFIKLKFLESFIFTALLVSVFIIEFKEPFLFKFNVGIFIFSFYYIFCFSENRFKEKRPVGGSMYKRT